MKKMITIGCIVLASTLLLTGCGSKMEAEGGLNTTEKRGLEAVAQKHMNKELLEKSILGAGEDAGWIMTEFKGNEIIAEKINGEDSITASVHFDSHGFHITPEEGTGDLKDAINDRLSSKSTGH